VELAPRHMLFFPYPHRLSHRVLQYPHDDSQTIERTFQLGFSYARVLELKNKRALRSKDLTETDVSRLGAANVFPWPKPRRLTITR
jgi:hypothetical protein